MISEKQAITLRLLQDGGEMYGLEIIRKSGGHLKRGSIYVLLDRMEDGGLVKSKMQDVPPAAQGPPRRVYRITAQGANALSEVLGRRLEINALLGLRGGLQ